MDTRCYVKSTKPKQTSTNSEDLQNQLNKRKSKVTLEDNTTIKEIDQPSGLCVQLDTMMNERELAKISHSPGNPNLIDNRPL